MDRTAYDRDYYDQNADNIRSRKRELYHQNKSIKLKKNLSYAEKEEIMSAEALKAFRIAYPPKETTDYAGHKFKDQIIKERLDQIAKDQWGPLQDKPLKHSNWFNKLRSEIGSGIVINTLAVK